MAIRYQSPTLPACLRGPKTAVDRPQSAQAEASALLRAIYLSEYKKLLGFLTRRVGPDLAADIAQEVFVRAAASSQLAHLLNPGGYLCRIAQNILIDRERRRRRRTEPLPLIEAIDAPVAPDQDHDLVASDLQQTLDRALDKLPARTRRIFVMHRFEDMAYRDIHRELGISLAAVEYHMGKALAHIRGAVAAVS